MNKYDFEQLTQSARNTNLADYFYNSAYTTDRHGSEVYIAEFPGLTVNERTNNWYSHYEGVGGKNSIDCLVKICGHDFKQAIFELTGRDVSENRSTNFPKNQAPQFTSPPKNTPPIQKELQSRQADCSAAEPPSSPPLFCLPDRDDNMRRVFAYLCKERKIPAPIVEELAHAGLLYQSRQQIKTTVNEIPQTFKSCNAVFVHKDKDGIVVGGEVQGVNSFKRFKGIVAGTGDSVFTFTPRPDKDGNTKAAYLFESAVDLVSFYSLCKPEKLKGVTLISMAGLKPTTPKLLQSQGVNVLSFVDNDNAGRKFEADNGFKRGSDLLEKAEVKDWNQFLKYKIENPKTVKNYAPEAEKMKLFGRKS